MERLTCLNENTEYPITSFFKADKSSIFGAYGHIPFCKKCIGTIANEFYKSYSDKKLAIFLTCMKLDVRFIFTIYENVCRDNISADRLALAYIEAFIESGEIGSFNDSGYSMGVFETIRTYLETGNANSDDIEESWVSYIVTQDDLDFWGGGGQYSQEEYYILSNTLNRYLESYPKIVDSASSIDLVRQICYTSLEIKKARESEKPDFNQVENLTKRLSSLLTDANMKPSQKKDALAEVDTFGLLIKKIEDEDPLPDPLPEWTDNDVFKDVGEWIVGHIGKMLGKDVDGVDNYEDEMKELTVTIEDDTR